jgi:hypothetical protein
MIELLVVGSIDNLAALDRSSHIGCFKCRSIYQKRSCKIAKTDHNIVCPGCSSSYVICDADFPILKTRESRKFLRQCHDVYFPDV